MRQEPTLHGVPFLIVVNEHSSVARSPLRAHSVAARLGVAPHQVHERPCRVITACFKDDTLTIADKAQLHRDLNAQFLSADGLGWFCAVDRTYARGGVWVSLPLTLLLPVAVRRTSPALRAVVACLGSNQVSIHHDSLTHSLTH